MPAPVNAMSETSRIDRKAIRRGLPLGFFKKTRPLLRASVLP
jgi:hypothetical protein